MAHVQEKSTNGNDWKCSNSAVSGRKIVLAKFNIGERKMILKSFNRVFVAIIYGLTCFQQCQSRQTLLKSTDADAKAAIPYKSCSDYMGKTVLHSMKFTPPNDDNCKWCYCDDGHAEACQSVWCEPPRCEFYTIGTLCCDFKCVSNQFELDMFNFFTFPVILVAFVTILVLVAIWCIYRFKKANARRHQWEDVAKLPSIVISENLYLEMSVDIIEKSDEINQLKKKISLLKHQLSYVENPVKTEDEV